MNFDSVYSELLQLADKAIEGILTPTERDRLESIVLESSEARGIYVQLLSQHAALQWSGADPQVLDETRSKDRSISIVSPPPVRAEWGRRWAWAASLLLVASAVVWLWVTRTAGPVATLLDFKGSKWNSGSLPTEHNSRLLPGRLRLAEGLVQIVFDSGAVVTLESPADFEIRSSMRCVLRSGRMVAKIPPEAHGFEVETPTGFLTDFGTEFGIHVRDPKTSDFQVFNGHVDVRHPATGRTETLKNGQGVRLTEEGTEKFNPDREDPAPVKPANELAPSEGRLIHLSTATGRGKDGYIQPMLAPPERRSDVLLLVKNTQPKHADWYRKAYIGFDLSSLDGLKILDAEFFLTFAPTGMGYAAQVPDATFRVYGLLDEKLDGWEEKSLRWSDAPANAPGGAAVNSAKTVLLGNFEIAQGQLSGTRSIRGKALVDFLNRDTNRTATLILVRETLGSGQSDLVHGFASRRHPELSPPTLKLTCVENRP